MESIQLTEVSGKIIGYELGDDNNAILKVRDENGRVTTVPNVELSEGATIPSGNVRIVTSIEFVDTGKGTIKGANYLFGANGKILIDTNTKQPYNARTGPKGRDKAEKERLTHSYEANGGEPKPAAIRKFKEEFLKSGKSVEDWNKTRA